MLRLSLALALRGGLYSSFDSAWTCRLTEIVFHYGLSAIAVRSIGSRIDAGASVNQLVYLSLTESHLLVWIGHAFEDVLISIQGDSTVNRCEKLRILTRH